MESHHGPRAQRRQGQSIRFVGRSIGLVFLLLLFLYVIGTIWNMNGCTLPGTDSERSMPIVPRIHTVPGLTVRSSAGTGALPSPLEVTTSTGLRWNPGQRTRPRATPSSGSFADAQSVAFAEWLSQVRDRTSKRVEGISEQALLRLRGDRQGNIEPRPRECLMNHAGHSGTAGHPHPQDRGSQEITAPSSPRPPRWPGR
jgi:hypothetical protein